VFCACRQLPPSTCGSFLGIIAAAMKEKGKRKPIRRPERIEQILRGFEQAYPSAACALEHTSPLELLVATILSAQCTDERVNIVTKQLFRKYRSAKDYAEAPPETLENDIRSTGFFRNKAKSIRGACRMIADKYEGKVPDTMESLLTLPGVARKTANVVLGVAFNKAEGIVVDTHRLDLSQAGVPEKVERDLMGLIPKDKWILFAHQTIFHGRQTCRARNPLCGNCTVEQVCSSEDKRSEVPSSRSRK
jgi:endonuclease-3